MGSRDENQPRFKSDTAVISARSTILRRFSSAPTRTIIERGTFCHGCSSLKIKNSSDNVAATDEVFFQLFFFFAFSHSPQFLSQQRSFINYFIIQTPHSASSRMTHASLIFSYSLIEWRFRELYNWRHSFACQQFRRERFSDFPSFWIASTSKVSRMPFRLRHCWRSLMFSRKSCFKISSRKFKLNRKENNWVSYTWMSIYSLHSHLTTLQA